jgi:hypothetical protein
MVLPSGAGNPSGLRLCPGWTAVRGCREVDAGAPGPAGSTATREGQSDTLCKCVTHFLRGLPLLVWEVCSSGVPEVADNHR